MLPKVSGANSVHPPMKSAAVAAKNVGGVPDPFFRLY